MKENVPNGKTKLLLFIPLIVLPFSALAFYALGGGKDIAKPVPVAAGINTALPDASFKKPEPENKMAYYELSEKDAIPSERSRDFKAEPMSSANDRADQQTQEITRKHSSLQTELARPVEVARPVPERKTEQSGIREEVDRLETLMKNMQSGKEEDTELSQISAMLEKIMDVQHPERVTNAYQQKNEVPTDSLFSAIPAEIPGKQTLAHGSVMKLRLLDSVMLGGTMVPKGHLLYGICNLTNQRLLMDVKTLRIGNRIIPVDLSLYGPDGIKGVEAPAAVIGNTLATGADDAVRDLRFITTEQSMGVQLAGAGIDAAKNLFSKKIKRIKIKLQPDFHVLLRNNKPANK